MNERVRWLEFGPGGGRRLSHVSLVGVYSVDRGETKVTLSDPVCEGDSTFYFEVTNMERDVLYDGERYVVVSYYGVRGVRWVRNDLCLYGGDKKAFDEQVRAWLRFSGDEDLRLR